MFAGLVSKPKLTYALCLFAIMLCFQTSPAQSDDENDPVKLFEKGQDAHAKGDFKRAIGLYDAAIKLKPEFPEAIDGFKRAVALRPDWALAYAKFGIMLAASGDSDRDAEPALREAIRLD